ncbi:MAG TPA: glycosyltransferase [Pirellulaceae bacterium]|jgi:glycosyltransferase involved in cell wall biosynthesis|nr:glycosyltransferase [Pirellulaceae bacterium]
MRLLCVSRSFWPLASPGAVLLRDRLAALARLGVEVTVFAARWDASWNDEAVIDGIFIRRLGDPAVGRQSHDRFDRVLAEKLRAEARKYDVLLASGAGRDGEVALRVEPVVRVPLVLCFDRPGPLGDGIAAGRWRMAKRKRERSERVAKALVTNPASYRDALAAGVEPSRIRSIPFAAGAPSASAGAVPSSAGAVAAAGEMRTERGPSPGGNPPPSTNRRAVARESLAEGQHALRLGHPGKAVAYLGSLYDPHRIAEFVRIVARQVDDYPSLRFWIVGDGPHSASIRRAADRAGISDTIELLGEFDAWDDVAAAADVVVIPSPAEPFSYAALAAVHAGTPALVAKSDAYDALGEGAIQIDTLEEAAWSEALSRLLAERRIVPPGIVPSHDEAAIRTLQQLATLPSPIRLA